MLGHCHITLLVFGTLTVLLSLYHKMGFPRSPWGNELKHGSYTARGIFGAHCRASARTDCVSLNGHAFIECRSTCAARITQ